MARNDDWAVTPSRSGFHLDRPRGKVFGVCSGIAAWTGIDATWVRIAFVAGTLLGFGSLALVYLIIALIAD